MDFETKSIQENRRNISHFICSILHLSPIRHFILFVLIKFLSTELRFVYLAKLNLDFDLKDRFAIQN